ncbi:hypothetical protein CAAN1_01S07096 [[Candida] anglica]|uniref:Mitochondrial zinc maintenance protein 1, mitochondrial n=1 Tax=[Candida] anglica TaxID=148631 RepID=A0ABP0ELG4_9ASCO
MKVTYKHAHRRAVVSLYRSLRRNCGKIDDNVKEMDPRMESEVVKGFALKEEIRKYNTDTKLYLSYLRAELMRAVQVEFRTGKWSIGVTNVNIMRERLMEGIELDENLDALNNKSTTVVPVMETLVKYRQRKHEEQKRRAQQLQGKLETEQVTKKDQRVISSRFGTLTRNQQAKRIKQELEKSAHNSKLLIQRYFKQLQLHHKIPNPFLLPYTQEYPLGPVHNMVRSSLLMRGSVRMSVLRQAYDWEYIEAVVKPSLAYDINKMHYLPRFQRILNDRGPFRVNVRTTEAGPMSMAYLEVPFPQLDELKEIAMDIKRSTRLIRLKTVWNATSGKDKSITESQARDGSFVVVGSKGFSSEERMFPRVHYEEWAEWEALWEWQQDNSNNFAQHLHSWTQVLDDASDTIDKELQNYFNHYRKQLQRDSPLFIQQKELQKDMNIHYDKLVERGKRLESSLVNNSVFKHGEIVNGEKVEQNLRNLVVREERKKMKKNRLSLPERERNGVGKQLGDYLEENGIRGFQWGHKYDKELPR